jgi:hypothetical protein
MARRMTCFILLIFTVLLVSCSSNSDDNTMMGMDSLIIFFTITAPSESSFPLGGEDSDDAIAFMTNFSSAASYFTTVDQPSGTI